MVRLLALGTLFAACRPGDTTPTETTDSPSTDPTTPTTPTVTTPTAVGPPKTLSVSCVPQLNVLRYDCTVEVDPPQPVEIRFSRTDGVGVERVRASEGGAGTHEITLYFMSAGHEYTATAQSTLWPDGLEASTTFVPDPVPLVVDSHLDVTGQATVGMVGTHNSCVVGAIVVIYDTETGELLWFQNLDTEGNLGLLDMVRYTDDGRIMGETHGNVVVMNPLGEELVKFPVDLGAHHDMTERDGLFYLLYREDVYDMQLDKVMILDSTGQELGQWHPYDHLPIPADGTGDWLHTNAIWVDEAGDIYLSWFVPNTIGKIAGLARSDFGEIDWVLAGSAPPVIGNDIVTDWSDIPAPGGFVIQHGLHLTHDGRVMFLDNGGGRGLLISVDEAAGTAHADASYDTGLSSCGAQGTAQDTLDGHVFAGCATGGLREYDATGQDLLWEGELSCANGTSPLPARWYPLDGPGW